MCYSNVMSICCSVLEVFAAVWTLQQVSVHCFTLYCTEILHHQFVIIDQYAILPEQSEPLLQELCNRAPSGLVRSFYEKDIGQSYIILSCNFILWHIFALINIIKLKFNGKFRFFVVMQPLGQYVLSVSTNNGNLIRLIVRGRTKRGSTLYTIMQIDVYKKQKREEIR